MQGLQRPLLIVACLSALLAFVYQQSEAIDISSVQKAQALIASIEFNESGLERDMLKIRNGEISHFDTLKDHRRALIDLSDQMETLLPVKIEAFAVLQQTIEDQGFVVEQFMSDQAVLSNSLRYLPIAIDSAMRSQPDLAIQLTTLHRDVLSFLRGSDAQQVALIREQLSDVKAAPILKKHVEHILLRNQRVLAMLQQLDSAVIAAQTQRINRQLDVYVEAGLEQLAWYQGWLLILALLLALYVGWVLWRQAKTAFELRLALASVDAEQAALDEHAIVSIADPLGNITYANDKFCKISGYRREELLGQNHRMVNSSHHPKLFFKNMWQTISDGYVWHGVIRNQDKSGNYYWVDTTIVPFLDEEKKPCRYVSIRTDITRLIEHEDEQRQQQKKLEHAQRLESLGVLAGGIAHDFNNILTSIMGNAGLVDRRLEAGNPAKEKIQRVIEASEKAATLCKQMLAYSGKGHFIVQACDMSQLVTEMMELLQVSMDKNVAITYALAENLPTIEADEAQMHQLIMNLITNANEATHGQNATIALSTGHEYVDDVYLSMMDNGEGLKVGDYVYLEVTDNGCGMDQATMDKIFEPFFTTKFTGRGLGMSALQGIVRGHGGAIEVNSELGRGTTIKVLMPASEQAVVVQQKSIDDQPNKAVDIGTALVVDDDEMVRELASYMLADMGFEILTAEDGLEAVQLYPDHMQEIRLVLLDMSMPKMDGDQTFRELRKMNPDVCVVLSSGYNEQEATERFKGKGLAGFVQKPYLPKTLEAVVNKALS